MRPFSPSSAPRRATRRLALLFACAILWAVPASAQSNGYVQPSQDGAGFESVLDPAIPYFQQLGLFDWMANPTAQPGLDLDAYHTLDQP